MAWRSAGSLSRSIASAAARRPAPAIPRLRPPNLAAPRLQSRFSSPRNLGELGCIQSLLPMHGAPSLTSHIGFNLRAFCELSHGNFQRTCQDR